MTAIIVDIFLQTLLINGYKIKSLVKWCLSIGDPFYMWYTPTTDYSSSSSSSSSSSCSSSTQLFQMAYEQ